MLKATRRLTDGVIAGAIAAGKVLVPTAVFVRPYVTGPNVNPPAVAADFTFSPAAAYNAMPITTWGAVQYLLDGRSAIAGPAITFVPGSGADSVTFQGYVLGDDSVTTNILAWEVFPVPYNLVDVHTPLTIIVRAALDPLQPWGATVVING